jgi:hypothetical protein
MTGTLVVAIIALCVSTATLTWQIVLYLLGASRPKVELRIGGMNEMGAMTAPIGGIDLDQLVRQGYETLVLAVEVQNRGRLAVSITAWRIAFDNAASYTQPNWAPNDRVALPHRLEPGAEAIFLCPLSEVNVAARALRKSSKPPKSCRASVSFGTGKTVRSKTRMALPVTKD